MDLCDANDTSVLMVTQYLMCTCTCSCDVSRKARVSLYYTLLDKERVTDIELTGKHTHTVFSLDISGVHFLRCILGKETRSSTM